MNKQLFPFQLPPPGADLRLESEECGETSLDLTAWYKKENKYERVKIAFKRCVGSKLSCLASGGKESIGVIENSNWLSELNSYQKKNHPDSMDNFKDMKHYYFRSHDETAEFLAEGYTWETVSEINY